MYFLYIKKTGRNKQESWDKQWCRQTCIQTDRKGEDAAVLVTPHLHHPFCARRAAGSYLCALPSCHSRHWSTERTHVGTYPTNPLLLLPRQTASRFEPGAGARSRYQTDSPRRAAGTGLTGSVSRLDMFVQILCRKERHVWWGKAQFKLLFSFGWEGGGGGGVSVSSLKSAFVGWRTVM